MRKVLFLTTYASPYRVEFFDTLGKHIDLTVLYSDRKEEQGHRSKDWFVEEKGHHRSVQLKKVMSLKNRALCLDVISWLRKPWDHIVLCGYSSPTVIIAMAYLRMRGIPYWLEVDGGLIRKDSRKMLMVKKALIGAASGWLSTGKATTDYLVHYGAKPDRVEEYPFSSLHEKDILDKQLTAKEKQDLRRELGMTGEYVLLSIGQFIHRKGFDVLMHAAAKLDSHVHIYIVGGEPTQEYLDLCRDLGLENIHYEGFMKKEQLLKYYKASDLFVLPTREDIWGLVINEAMAFGLPVITTNRCVAGLELVKPGINGDIVPVEDAHALANSIKKTLAGDLDAMGAAALDAVRPYTIENMAKVHMDIFENRRL